MSLVFQSQAMMHVVERARRFARTSATVLISGESGTGKELIARYVHDQSGRSTQPYVRVNCAALTESLVESELFGHERGAFTGAAETRIGRLEAAAGGTLFLDEISEVPQRVQAKLLRVLEEEEFQRVGSNTTRRLEARILASSNRNLERHVARKRFRADLYYRLNVLRLELPPLRERKEDVPPLTQHFVNTYRGDSTAAVRGVTPRAMQTLCGYDWPGNIRELRNVIYRACVLAEAPLLDVANLQKLECAPPAAAPSGNPYGELRLEEIERQAILARLQHCGGNKAAAAAALGVTPRTLRNKLTQYRRLGHVS
ncbi:MAG: sigma-54-dependent Fis family transcriptional regulator [Planctomycetaceae bacterium]|nr:sigma-54-dependent Fis family transcriptional regulator [Planctomycetaceae bacterium]